MSKPSSTNYLSSHSHLASHSNHIYSSKYNKSSSTKHTKQKLIVPTTTDEMKTKECDTTHKSHQQPQTPHHDDEKKIMKSKIIKNHTNTKLDSQSQIENVWAHNLIESMVKIEQIIEDYPFVALDTEFPGVVARPVDTFRHWLGYAYRLVAQNVNMLKLIQLGLTFYNEKGETPSNGISTWQFNFKFNIISDMYAPDSIELLQNSGINFTELAANGIDHNVFAEYITMSGLVLNEDIRWIVFHGCYDFAYLIKTLCVRDLPKSEKDFFWFLNKYFPYIYDIKVLVRNVHSIKGGGLEKLVNSLNLKRKANIKRI
eukprot:470651_1